MVEEKNNKLRTQGWQKRPGICVIRIIERKEKECGVKNIWRHTGFPSLAKDGFPGGGDD